MKFQQSSPNSLMWQKTRRKEIEPPKADNFS